MKFGRRDFLMAGSGAAGAGFLPAAQALAAPAGVARSVTEFGVEPNTDADQTAALQKAIDAISGAGEAVHFPGGTYRLSQVQLPPSCALTGVSGQTQLVAQSDDPVCQLADARSLYLSGLTFEGSAISGTADQAVITGITVRNAPGYGVVLSGIKSASVSQCMFHDCKQSAVDITTGRSVDYGAILTGNHVTLSQNGIVLKGSGNVSGNFVAATSRYGLQIGGDWAGGSISAVNNTIIDCGIGIGVAANLETILVSLNLINRMRLSVASAIRAFDGKKLIGPDLALESAEAYLNLNVVGNVAR